MEELEAATTLRVRGVSRTWAGLRTFSPDNVPVVGFDLDHPGFFWLAGQGGYGIKTAPALGRLTASLITGTVKPPPLPPLGPLALGVERLRPSRGES